LLRSGEHGSENSELHQGGATICDSLLWAEGVPGGQIHQRMCAQYGDNALSRRVVYEWIEMFKNGRTSVTDAERLGHPITATTAQNEEGPLLETYLRRGTTVTSATYCDMLQGGLKSAIRSERRRRLSEGVLLLHGNARPHTAARTLETLRKLKWEVMEHPVHSSDLGPSNFHLFGPLTEALGGRRFRGDEDVRARCVSGYVRNQKLSIMMALNGW
jgi:hypothetical protein